MEQTARNLDASTLEYDSAAENVPAYNPVLHRLAQLTAVATLVLIFMGGASLV